jgi:uncharacterized membrane protein YiaA
MHYTIYGLLAATRQATQKDHIQSAPENRRFLKFKKTAWPLLGASILTIIVYSAVWNLIEMGMYLCVNFSTLP